MSEIQEMTEREAEKLNHGRLVREDSRVLMPMIMKRREEAIQRLITHFRAGEVAELLPTAAEISCWSSLEAEISRSNKQTESLERRIYGSTEG